MLQAPQQWFSEATSPIFWLRVFLYGLMLLALPLLAWLGRLQGEGDLGPAQARPEGTSAAP